MRFFQQLERKTWVINLHLPHPRYNGAPSITVTRPHQLIWWFQLDLPVLLKYRGFLNDSLVISLLEWIYQSRYLSQSVTLHHSLLLFFSLHCNVLQSVAVYQNLLQLVLFDCNMLQSVTFHCMLWTSGLSYSARISLSCPHYIAVICSLPEIIVSCYTQLQFVTFCIMVYQTLMQCVTFCIWLQHVAVYNLTVRKGEVEKSEYFLMLCFYWWTFQDMFK